MLGFWPVGKRPVGSLLVTSVSIYYPNSDIAVDGWVSSDAQPLYTDIDEETASDTDYIISPELTSTASGATFGLTTSLTAGTYDVNIRARKTETTGQIRVVLKDSGGTSVGATNWQVLTGSYVSYVLRITTTGTATQSTIEARTEPPITIEASISETNSIATTEDAVVPGAGLFKTTYAGYFADNVNFFASATPQGFGSNPTTEVQTTQIYEPSSDDGSNFSVQWLGYFKPTTTQTYTFTLSSDDASYMWIGPTAVTGFTTSNALINNGGPHGNRAISGSIALTADQYYTVRIQFGEINGGDILTFNYQTPTIGQTSIVTGLVFYNPATNGF